MNRDGTAWAVEGRTDDRQMLEAVQCRDGECA